MVGPAALVAAMGGQQKLGPTEGLPKLLNDRVSAPTPRQSADDSLASRLHGPRVICVSVPERCHGSDLTRSCEVRTLEWSFFTPGWHALDASRTQHA